MPPDSAGRLGDGAAEQVQQAAGADQETDDADQPQRRPEIDTAIAIRIQAEQGDPGDAAKHERHRVGHEAEEPEGEVGHVRPDQSADIVQGAGHASGAGPARIVGRIAGQAGEQIEQQRRDRHQRQFAPKLLPTVVACAAGIFPKFEPPGESASGQGVDSIIACGVIP